MFSHCFRRFRIVFAILSFFGLRKDAEGAKICKKLLFSHRYGKNNLHAFKQIFIPQYEFAMEECF